MNAGDPADRRNGRTYETWDRGHQPRLCHYRSERYSYRFRQGFPQQYLCIGGGTSEPGKGNVDLGYVSVYRRSKSHELRIVGNSIPTVGLITVTGPEIAKNCVSGDKT